MIDWQALAKEYDAITQELASPSLDHKRRKELQQKASQQSALLSLHTKMQQLSLEKQDIMAQMEKEQGELKELFADELEALKRKESDFKQQIDDILYPPDPRDERSVFVEIRAGAGGQEAALFVADLFRMYHNYALSRGWQASLIDDHATDIGGYKELIMHIKGKNVYKYLKFESGVHRVQRVPKTEAQGRVHTSTVTVAVLPEAEDVDITINPNDLRIDVFRSSGAGGQSVNTTDSAVRIVHIPTGLVVTCQDERSQHKNKAKALKVLASRLLEAEKERKEAERSAQRKQQVGTGQRAEKIRTYNFPQNRVSDHRIELTLKKLDMVMQGDMNDLLNPLLSWDLEQRRLQTSNF